MYNLKDYNEFSKEYLNSLKDSDYNKENILSGKVPYNGYDFVFNIEKLIHNYPIEKCKYSNIHSKSLIDSKSIEDYRDKFNVKNSCEAFVEKMSKVTSNPSEETRKKMSKSKSNMSEETREKMSKSRLGKKHSEETIEKMSKSKSNMSEETREKMSKSHLGKKHSKESIEKMRKAQSNRSEETREKMSKSRLGKKHSEETIEKMSKAKSGENHPMYGKKHSEEVKEKISKAKSNMSEETKENMSTAQAIKLLNNRDNNPNKIEVYSKSYNENIYVHKGEVFCSRFLDHLNIKYKYECKSFPYINKKGLTSHYTPDFYLPKYNLYIEVKGDRHYPSREKINSVINEGKNLLTVQPRYIDNNKYDLYNTLELYRKGILKGYNIVKTKSSIIDLFEIGIDIIDKISKFTYSKEISGIMNTHNYTTFEDDGFIYCKPGDNDK